VNSRSSDKVKGLQHRWQASLDEHIDPNEHRFHDETEKNRWLPTKIVEGLKPKARDAGPWSLFLPESQHGAGLTNLEYAPLCEIMERSPMVPEVFNCVESEQSEKPCCVAEWLVRFYS
jgi:acyl-CoA dehydrogenase